MGHTHARMLQCAARLLLLLLLFHTSWFLLEFSSDLCACKIVLYMSTHGAEHLHLVTSCKCAYADSKNSFSIVCFGALFFLLYFCSACVFCILTIPDTLSHTRFQQQAVAGTCSMRAPEGFAHLLPDNAPGRLPDWLSAHELNCLSLSVQTSPPGVELNSCKKPIRNRRKPIAVHCFF